MKRAIKPTEKHLELINNDQFIRAGGDCICNKCGLLYKQHQTIEITQTFHLNELCDGTLVKL